MILDNEQQRQFLLEMFKQVNFPGAVLDMAYATREAIRTAGSVLQPADPRAATDAAAGPPAAALPTMGASQ